MQPDGSIHAQQAQQALTTNDNQRSQVAKHRDIGTSTSYSAADDQRISEIPSATVSMPTRDAVELLLHTAALEDALLNERRERQQLEIDIEGMKKDHVMEEKRIAAYRSDAKINELKLERLTNMVRKFESKLVSPTEPHKNHNATPYISAETFERARLALQINLAKEKASGALLKKELDKEKALNVRLREEYEREGLASGKVREEVEWGRTVIGELQDKVAAQKAEMEYYAALDKIVEIGEDVRNERIKEKGKG